MFEGRIEYKVKRLSDHPYANCKIVTSENAIVMVSYTTEVIRANKGDGGWILSCTGLYSRTTIKQIGWFLKEYFPSVSYQDIKAIADTDYCILLDINRVKYNDVLYNQFTNELVFNE